MKVVLQQEPSGCGLAAVAMLTGHTYEEVKKLANSLGIFAEDPCLYSETGSVRRLLKRYGLRVAGEEAPFTSWEELPQKALLAIKYRIENDQPLWHWVVFVREGGKPVVLDPATYVSNNMRTDFETMQPKWFIEVYDT